MWLIKHGVFWLLCLIWNIQAETEQWFAYEWSQDISDWAIKANQTVYLNPNAWNSDQECFFYGGLNSLGGLPIEGATWAKKIGNISF